MYLLFTFARSHIEMGRVGAPYDVHMVEDAIDVLPKYKAAIFASPLPSEAGKRAVELCRKLNIPCLLADLAHCVLKADEIRAFLEGAGVHLYVEGKDVIYAGNGYVGIHAATEGEKTVKLPARWKVTPVFGSTLAECVTDRITLQLEQYETALFAVSAPENE